MKEKIKKNINIMSTGIRKELISYYKWATNLSTFILTITMSFVALKTEGLINNKWAIIISWLFLSACVFFNWVLVKKLITIPIIEETEKKNKIHELFINSLNNLKIYGLLQNVFFLVGILFLIVFFFSNI